MRKLARQYLPMLLCLGLLAGVAAEKAKYHSPPADTASYHEAVRSAAAMLPMRVGPWIGTDVPLPSGAVALLQPNVIISRRFENVRTGRQVTFLLVQCRDARDMLGHYPPVCYRGQGWTGRAARPRDWAVDDLRIEGMEYEFASNRLDRTSEIVVDDFMILPDGRTCRDMDGVDAVAQDYRKKFHGAAQVQLISDLRLDPEERRDVFESLVRANRKLIERIRSGGV